VLSTRLRWYVAVVSIFSEDRGFYAEVTRLDEPPAHVQRDADGVYWQADVSDVDDGPLTIHAWVTGTDFGAAELEADPDRWVVEELGRFYRTTAGEDLGAMYAFGTIQLRPSH
jgi:hypothetical protein